MTPIPRIADTGGHLGSTGLRSASGDPAPAGGTGAPATPPFADALARQTDAQAPHATGASPSHVPTSGAGEASGLASPCERLPVQGASPPRTVRGGKKGRHRSQAATSFAPGFPVPSVWPVPSVPTPSPAVACIARAARAPAQAGTASAHGATGRHSARTVRVEVGRLPGEALGAQEEILRLESTSVGDNVSTAAPAAVQVQGPHPQRASMSAAGANRTAPALERGTVPLRAEAGDGSHEVPSGAMAPHLAGRQTEGPPAGRGGREAAAPTPRTAFSPGGASGSVRALSAQAGVPSENRAVPPAQGHLRRLTAGPGAIRRVGQHPTPASRPSSAPPIRTAQGRVGDARVLGARADAVAPKMRDTRLGTTAGTGTAVWSTVSGAPGSSGEAGRGGTRTHEVASPPGMLRSSMPTPGIGTEVGHARVWVQGADGTWVRADVRTADRMVDARLVTQGAAMQLGARRDELAQALARHDLSLRTLQIQTGEQQATGAGFGGGSQGGPMRHGGDRGFGQAPALPRASGERQAGDAPSTGAAQRGYVFDARA